MGYTTPRPSQHLSWSELACKDDARTPYPEALESTAILLGVEFERVRSLFGKPLIVDSAYRTEAHNRAVGGARNSQHVLGCALDVRPASGGQRALDELLRIVLSIVELDKQVTRIRGVGSYQTFVHFDIRQTGNGNLVRWDGARPTADLVKVRKS